MSSVSQSHHSQQDQVGTKTCTGSRTHRAANTRRAQSDAQAGGRPPDSIWPNWNVRSSSKMAGNGAWLSALLAWLVCCESALCVQKLLCVSTFRVDLTTPIKIMFTSANHSQYSTTEVQDEWATLEKNVIQVPKWYKSSRTNLKLQPSLWYLATWGQQKSPDNTKLVPRVVSKNYHLVKMQCCGGKLWILAFMHMFLWHTPPTETLLETKYTPWWWHHSQRQDNRLDKHFTAVASCKLDSTAFWYWRSGFCLTSTVEMNQNSKVVGPKQWTKRH